MLAGLSIVTGEAASLAFENLIFERAKPVAEAERDLAKAEIDRARSSKSPNAERKRSPASQPMSKQRETSSRDRQAARAASAAAGPDMRGQTRGVMELWRGCPG